MRLRSAIKKAVPTQWRPFAISTYLKGRAVYFSCYRRVLRPSPKYLAVAEQNYYTGAPPEWTSVSLDSADIVVDLETEYVFELHGVKYAYSGHTIEHLSNDAVKRLFRNLFSSMRPGGIVRIECPDLDMLLDDYRCVHNNDRKVTKRIMELYEQWHMEKVDPRYTQEHLRVLAGIVSFSDRDGNMLTPLCSAEEFHEKIATLSNAEFGDWAVSLLTPEQLRDSHLHRNWFTFDKLKRFLTEAGFSGVVRCAPAATRYGFRMNINRTHRSWCSLFVEAVKR
jgi:predicted SAM-dependent methyltransferase